VSYSDRFPILWPFGRHFDWDLEYRLENVRAQHWSGQRYFVRPHSDIDPELVFVEYLCNMIAHIVGIGVPPFAVVSVNGKYAFISEDFSEGKEVKNLADMVGSMAKQPMELGDIILAMRRVGLEERDVVSMTSVAMYDALIGNYDRHAGNVSFIETKTGYRMAPSYDNHSFYGWGIVPRKPLRSMAILVGGKRPTVTGVLAESRARGVETMFHKEIFYAKVKVLDLIRGFQPISTLRKRLIREHVKGQYELLETHVRRNGWK